ncbi:MAG: hypothetical protein ABIN96_17640, partial [Rubrivivax sp.]
THPPAGAPSAPPAPVAPLARRTWLASAGAGLLVLAGCSKQDAASAGKAPSPTSPAAPQSPPAGAARDAFDMAAPGKGFATGELIAARLARVFFDPQCPHCAALWQASKPLRDRVRMVWMPVAFIAPPSATQGALLLASDDPAALMDKHEAALAAGTGGLDVSGAAPPAEALASVKANTELWKRIGGGGVPHMLYRAGADGPYGAQEGQLSTEQLARVLGL